LDQPSLAGRTFGNVLEYPQQYCSTASMIMATNAMVGGEVVFLTTGPVSGQSLPQW